MVKLTDLTISQALDGLKKKEFSATELNKAYIEAMESNRSYNAYVLETPEKALEQAKASDERYQNGSAQALDGIPLGVKDLFCTKGIRTTACSHILDGFVPSYEFDRYRESVKCRRDFSRQVEYGRVCHGRKQ